MTKTLKKYVIEREIPGIEGSSAEQLKAAAATSNAALAKLGPKVQWLESFLVKDRTYCVYLAEDVDVIREHARLSGFPATQIAEVTAGLDPSSAS